MFDGKCKALTFSYDDGVKQDVKLIEIFNKYNLKATFNLNSQLFGAEKYITTSNLRIEHSRLNMQDIKHIYDGHEVASHTLTHPDLTKLNDEEIVSQVEQDRINLSELVGYEVLGMAYPYGGVNDHIAEVLKEHTGVKYARSVSTTKDFKPCRDLFQYKGTISHHMHWDMLFDIGKRFLELQASTPQILYIWGHSYEFDIFKERWDIFEEFCKMMSNQNDIYYGTNIEIFNLLNLV